MSHLVILARLTPPPPPPPPLSAVRDIFNFQKKAFKGF